MSLKDNVSYVKEELNTEEKFLESFVKVERFYKKNKLIILVILFTLVLGTIAYVVTNYIQTQNKIEANIAFNKVLENPKDKEALSILKEKNQKLFEVAQYLETLNNDKIANTQVVFLKELSKYKAALQKNSIEELNSISMEKDFLLKEFAIFNKALILTKNKKFDEAKATLKLIPNSSQVYNLAKMLNHYLITK